MPRNFAGQAHAAAYRIVGAFALCALSFGVAPASAQPLSFFKNYFVTGDFVVRGVSLFGNGQNGVSRASIKINDFPEDNVDLLAAFLYVQTAERIDLPGSGIHNAQFRGFDLGPKDNSYTKALNWDRVTPVCWIKQPGYRMVTYRGDVLRLLRVKANGKHEVNGSHSIAVPEFTLPGPWPVGASLVLVYRERGRPLKGIVIYDGGVTKAAKDVLTQPLAGFYDASGAHSARMAMIAGVGTPPLSEKVSVDGKLVATNPFRSADGHLWDNPTFPNVPLTYDDRATVQVGPDGPRSDCLTYSAMVLGTDVQDTDEDGLLDAWENNTGALADPNGQPLPPLKLMGADPVVKDLFVEVGYMHTNGAALSYGLNAQGMPNPPRPAHSHLPSAKALQQAADMFGRPGVNIRVHFDVGNHHQNNGSPPPHVIPAALARGGEGIDEMVTVCTPPPGETDPSVCQYRFDPGTVGWKSGYRVLRDQVLVGPPPAANGDDPCDAPNSACVRRFDRNRKDIFHYTLFVHALGMPKDPCFLKDAAGDFVVENGGPVIDPTCNTPDFHVPRTNSGIADFPGGDGIVALGAFDDSSGLPIGTDYMQVATWAHESGHNFEFTHAGPPQIPREPNCKPNYLSVMNYLFQLRGLLNAAGEPLPDFSGQVLTGINETGLVDGPFPSVPYRTGWYAPLATSYLDGFAPAATKHCDGSDLLTADDGTLLEPPMVRVDSLGLASDGIDWNADGLVNTGGVNDGVQDVNFNGVTLALNDGANDWANIRLNELGGRRSVGGFFKVGDRYFMGPLSLDIGRGDIGRGDIGRGDIGRGDIGRGDIGRGDIGRGDIGRGDIGRGDIGRGDIGRGDIGRGDIGRGDFGGGDMDVGTASEFFNGELDYETFIAATGNAPTPPNALQACLTTEAGTCAAVGGNRPVLLTWQVPNVGQPTSYSIYRFEYDPAAAFPPATLPTTPVAVVSGIPPIEGEGLGAPPTQYVDAAGGAMTVAYYVTAQFADGTTSGISNFATVAIPGPIDFEQFTGRAPSFSTVDPPLTVGVATFTGGQIIGASTTNLPANPTIVYGTASFCTGCAPAITIDFSRPVSNFSVFLMNGAPSTVEYTIQDSQGGLQTVSLVSTGESGAQTISLPTTGIVQVVITPTAASTFWDFLIDNVQFTIPPS